MVKSRKGKGKPRSRGRRPKTKLAAEVNTVKQDVENLEKEGGLPQRPRGGRTRRRWGFGVKGLKVGPVGVDEVNFSTRRQARGMVGLGSRAINVQKTVPRLTTSFVNGVQYDVIEGTDLLATVTSGLDGNQVGDILLELQLSPVAFTQTRLFQFAQLYQRYRFSDIQFIYEPIANATQSGQLIGYADFDVDNNLAGNSSSNIQVAAAHQGQQINQIWEPMTFDMKQAGTFTDLYTQVGLSETDDPRLVYQGTFYLLAASVLGSTLPLGNLYVRYKVLFSIPYLSTNSYGGGYLWTRTYIPNSVTFLGGSGNEHITFGTYSTPVTIGTSPIKVSTITFTQFTIPVVSQQLIYISTCLMPQIAGSATTGPISYDLTASTCEFTPSTIVSATWTPGSSVGFVSSFDIITPGVLTISILVPASMTAASSVSCVVSISSVPPSLALRSEPRLTRNELRLLRSLLRGEMSQSTSEGKGKEVYSPPVTLSDAFKWSDQDF